MRSLKTGPMTPEQAHMQAAKNVAELVARRAQVRALRKISKALYLSICKDSPWTQEQMDALKLYEREML